MTLFVLAALATTSPRLSEALPRWLQPPTGPHCPYGVLRSLPQPHTTPAQLYLPKYTFCAERGVRGHDTWDEICTVLPKAWARGGRAMHFAIQLGQTDERDMRAYAVGLNAGDAILTWAARLAFSYFLGHPEWLLRECHIPMSVTDLRTANSEPTLAVIVGGGGLFYSLNRASLQNISGWQWQVPTPHLTRLDPPLFLFGVGWNEFRHTTSTRYRSALMRSLTALAAKSSTMIGLREQYSLDAMTPLIPLRNATITYQPCATTLLGAIQPCMTNRVLLHKDSPRRLSVNVAGDNLMSRLGVATYTSVMREIAGFCERALANGWAVDLVHHLSMDAVFHRFLRQHFPNVAKHVATIQFTSHEHMLDYYGRVTVAISSRGHGVMVPFGLQAATISMIAHDKVASFIRDIGHREWGVEIDPTKRPGGNASGISEELWYALEHIHGNRALIHRQILEAQARLMAITAENMRRFASDMLPRARNLK